MPLLSISAAANAAGVNRRTLQRAIADGRLSVTRDAQGKRGIDPAELFRVFAVPAPVTATLSQSVALEAATSAEASTAIAVLETAALDALRAQLAAAAEREAWLRRLLDEERAARFDLEQRVLPAPRRSTAERLAALMATARSVWRGVK